MDTQLDWADIVVRISLAFAAGAVIGYNREENGRPAGLRTTVLVCLAAAGAMVLSSILIDTTGRPADSFVTMDVMRLPLGVLTGVGFIGAGAILHKANFVLGVTTAATLWYSTIMGFCFGAGELALGIFLLILGLLILWGLKWVENHLIQHCEASLIIQLAAGGPSPDELLHRLRSSDLRPTVTSFRSGSEGDELSLQIQQRRTRCQATPPVAIMTLRTLPGVRNLHWKPAP
jgi:putative Mg2+ transporter-C (MgtC) family protein